MLLRRSSATATATATATARRRRGGGMRCRRTGLRWRRLDHGLRVEGIRGWDRRNRRMGGDGLGQEPLVRVEVGLVGRDD